MAILVDEQTSWDPTCQYFSVYVAGNYISTTVTSSDTAVNYWISETLRHRRCQWNNLIVGVGVQWRPSYIPGGREPAATLQLCVGRRCLIFHLAYASSVPDLLRGFLWNPSYTFVGLWNHSDAQKLLNSRHALAMRAPLDLRYYVLSSSGESLARASIETIAREVLGFEGVRMEDWISRSDWEALILSHSQIGQACADAFVAFEIGKNIRAFEICRNQTSPVYVLGESHDQPDQYDDCYLECEDEHLFWHNPEEDDEQVFWQDPEEDDEQLFRYDPVNDQYCWYHYYDDD